MTGGPGSPNNLSSVCGKGVCRGATERAELLFLFLVEEQPAHGLMRTFYIYLKIQAVGGSLTHGLFFCKKVLFLNIVLIGPRWSGKTETGRMLAVEIGGRFIDTDDMVERMAGVSISTLVQANGWNRFRDLEALAVRRVALEDGLVIATGGGVVTRAENIRRLRRNGWIVRLKATEETLRIRKEADSDNGNHRPPLCGVSPAEEIRRIVEERTPLYDHAGDLAVETDGLSPIEVAERIMACPLQKIMR